MRTIKFGDVTISDIIERDGPWRTIGAMFPTADVAHACALLKDMEPFIYDPASDRIVITYRSFVVGTPHHNILIDTCTGEHKNYPAPMDFPKQSWLDGLRALRLGFADIDYVFCTHLHIDHTGWNTQLVDGRWVPTFPNAKYIFHKREYAYWEEQTRIGGNPHFNAGPVWTMNCLPVVEAGQALLVDENYSLDDTFFLSLTPGHSPHHCCVHIRSGGREAIVLGDMMHHALQCREPDWSTGFCSDPAQAARTRWRFFGQYAGSGIKMLPVHFPNPTAGTIEAAGSTFRYRFDEG
jgi:glyoxylase-like metal-dependent hydrolase (beta-lactamase superfamily II)